MFRPPLPFVLIALQSALHGQDLAAFVRMGDSALRAGLWETAASHYGSALESKGLTAKQKADVAIRLAESWTREGKYAAALDLLDRSFVAGHPDAPFWKGAALMGAGRLGDADTQLRKILDSPDSPLRAEAGFSIANIQLALADPGAALAVLDRIPAEADPRAAARARLRKMEILLDLGKHAEARAIMPPADGVPLTLRPAAALLTARLQLAEGDFPAAAAGFQALLDKPQGQSARSYQLAATGMADALLGMEKSADASAFLLKFIEDHPDSESLEPLFDRLVNALPAKPAANDPVIARLGDWCPPCEGSPDGWPGTVGSSAASASPSTQREITALQANAMFSAATAMRRVGTPEAVARSRRLLDRLRLELPGTAIADRALLESSRREMESGNAERAMILLDALRETASTPGTRGRAAFEQAAEAYQRGDRKLAGQWFNEAASLLARPDADTARLNAELVALATPVATDSPRQNAAPSGPPVPDLVLERALSAPDPAARRAAIEDFLTKFPDHPRVAEARLAAAEAALTGAKPDLSFARAQLDTVEESPEKAAEIPPARIAWLRLRILDRGEDPAAMVAAARAFLTNFPADPLAPDASFILGRHLFESRSYNDARLVLEKLAASQPDSPLAQASWLLAARSAALVRTSQSQQEALILFDKIIRSKDSSATPLAMLEKGQLLIDMNRLKEAEEFLRKWFDSLKPSDPLRVPSGFLLGEAVYAQGSANPASLTGALAVYDKLLDQAGSDGALYNRIQYLRGKTLEQIPDPKDPARKREKEAFIAYYSVLEKSDTPAEWHYFELCGFRAVALLEKAGRWSAAIACSKKLASFNGPRAQEAATRASQLQLKHMIWED